MKRKGNGNKPTAPRAGEALARRRDAWLVYAMTVAASLALLVGFIPFGASQVTDWPLLCLALTGIAAAVVLWLGRRGEVTLDRRWTWAAGALLAWALLSAALSGQPFSAMFGVPGSSRGWCEWLVIAAVVVAASGRADAAKDAVRAAAPFILVWEAALIALQYSEGAPDFPGSLSNSGYMAEVVVMLLPIAASVAPDDSMLVARLRYASAALGVAAVAVSGARVGFVVALGWLAVVLFYGIRRSATSRSRWVLAIAAALVVLAAIPVGIRAYRSGGAGIGAFVDQRVALASGAFGGMLERPVAGWGPDGYLFGAGRHISAPLLDLAGPAFGQYGVDPHNAVANVAVSLGVVGLLLGGWLVVEIVRVWRGERRETGTWSPLTIGVALYTVQTLATPAALQTLPLAALVLGASLGRPSPQSRDMPRWAVVSLASVVAVAAAALGALAFTGLTIQRVDTAGTEDPRPIQQAAQTWRSPWFYHVAAIEWAYAIDREPALAAQKPDLAAAKRAVELEPANSVYLTDLGRTLAYYDEASSTVIATYRRALDLFPESPDTRAALGHYYLQLGDVRSAERMLADLERNAPEARRTLELGIAVSAETGDSVAEAEYRRRLQEFERRSGPLGW